MTIKLAPSLLAIALMAFARVMTAGVAFADPKGCRSGLVTKNPTCVPLGQAKNGVTIDRWLNVDRTGDVNDRGDLIYLDDFVRHEQPHLPYGQRYAAVNDRIAVIEAETYKILQLIVVFGALANLNTLGPSGAVPHLAHL